LQKEKIQKFDLLHLKLLIEGTDPGRSPIPSRGYKYEALCLCSDISGFRIQSIRGVSKMKVSLGMANISSKRAA
jgi:hypothetical protein